MGRVWRWILGNPHDFINGKTEARRKLLTSEHGACKLPCLPAGLPTGTPGRKALKGDTIRLGAYNP